MFSGVVAFVLLIGFVVASLAGRLSYQTFVLVQRLLGAAFVLGAFHAFAVRGTAASSPALTIYLACLTAAGVASLGYRLIGARLGVGRRRYRVDEVRRLADGRRGDRHGARRAPARVPGRAVRVRHVPPGRDPARVAPVHDRQRAGRRAADRRQAIRRLHEPA